MHSKDLPSKPLRWAPGLTASLSRVTPQPAEQGPGAGLRVPRGLQGAGPAESLQGSDPASGLSIHGDRHRPGLGAAPESVCHGVRVLGTLPLLTICGLSFSQKSEGPCCSLHFADETLKRLSMAETAQHTRK